MFALLTLLSERVTLLSSAGCSLQIKYPVLTWTCSADPVAAKPAVQFLVTCNPAASCWMEHVAVACLSAIVLPAGPVAWAVTVSVQPSPTQVDVELVIVAP
jgi:hypothetical protein